MRVTFVLPNPIRIPMGGAKVVYEHAAGLVALGHSVQVVAPRQMRRGPLGLARRAAVAVRDRMHGVADSRAYAASGVATLDLPTPAARHFPEADVVIATGVQTVPWVAALPPEKGRSLYFIQGDETFVRPEARDSWRLGLPLATCAEWLADEMHGVGLSPLAVIPNAVNPAEFDLDQPIEDRQPRVLALYHRHTVKGPDVLVDALNELLRLHPDAEADVFCARPPSHRLPGGVRVHIRPSPEKLRALYNRAAVLLHPSRSEGWPLVPMEAAMCGAAVVASANRGVLEYLQDGVTMRTAPVGDGLELGRLAASVLTDVARRVLVATNAREAVSQYTWAASTARLDAVLRDLVL